MSAPRPCSACGEEGRPAVARGLCARCYQRWRTTGDASQPRKRVATRPLVIRSCIHPDGCTTGPDGAPGDATAGKGGANGWCRTHYMRIGKTGDPGEAGPRKPGSVARVGCSTPGCANAHAAKGYCHACYKKLKRYGDPAAPNKPGGRKIGYRKPAVECRYPGCTEQGNGHAAALGYCPMHYKRNWTHGDPSIALKVKAYNGRPCSKPGCDDVAKANGLCVNHYAVVSGHRRRARLEGLDAHHTETEWETVLEERGGLCFYCDEPATERDHVVALSRGGTDTIENIRPACRPCNTSKNARDLETFLAGR